MRSAVRRTLFVVCVLAFVTFVATASVVAVLLEASATAPPPVEPRDVDYDDPPSQVVADAIHNLQTTSFTLDLAVQDTGDRADVSPFNGTGVRFEDGPATTLAMHVEIDNPARRYSARVRSPAWAGNRTIRLYGETPMEGHVDGPRAPDADPSWESDRKMGYRAWRGQLRPRPGLATANATLVEEDATSYVVRITDDRVAMEVGHPGMPGAIGVRMPPLSDANANLTVGIDKQLGVVLFAEFRYHHQVGDRAIRTTHVISDVGTTDVERPLGSLPPGLDTLLYRLDMGLWAADTLDWLRAAVYAVGVLWLAAVGVRRKGWSPW